MGGGGGQEIMFFSYDQSEIELHDWILSTTG